MFPMNQARWQGSVDSMVDQTLSFVNLENPPGSMVFADTAGLGAGFYDITFCVNCTVACAQSRVVLEWRNAANSASLWNLGWDTTGAKSDIFNLFNLKVAAGERFRIYNYLSLSGLLMTSIIATRRAT